MTNIETTSHSAEVNRLSTRDARERVVFVKNKNQKDSTLRFTLYRTPEEALTKREESGEEYNYDQFLTKTFWKNKIVFLHPCPSFKINGLSLLSETAEMFGNFSQTNLPESNGLEMLAVVAGYHEILSRYR